MVDKDDAEKLRRDQAERSAEEAERAETSELPTERRAHARRADKAAYLEEKLAERERSEREQS